MYVNPHFYKNKKLGKNYFDYQRGVRLGKERTTSLSRNVPKDGTPCSMHTQLVKNNIRPLGIKPDTGSCSRANINAHVGWDSKRVPTVSVARQQTSHRGTDTLREESNIKNPSPTWEGFPLKNVCGSKEGRECKTHHRPERSKQVRDPRTFQDGGNPPNKGYIKREIGWSR